MYGRRVNFFVLVCSLLTPTLICTSYLWLSLYRFIINMSSIKTNKTRENAELIVCVDKQHVAVDAAWRCHLKFSVHEALEDTFSQFRYQTLRLRWSTHCLKRHHEHRVCKDSLVQSRLFVGLNTHFPLLDFHVSLLSCVLNLADCSTVLDAKCGSRRG